MPPLERAVGLDPGVVWLEVAFRALVVPVDLDDGGIHHRVHHVGFSQNRLEQPDEDVGRRPIPDARVIEPHLPNEGGCPAAGLPFARPGGSPRRTACCSSPLRPGSPGSPRRYGSIFVHWTPVKTNLSMGRLNHGRVLTEILSPNRPSLVRREQFQWTMCGGLQQRVDIRTSRERVTRRSRPRPSQIVEMPGRRLTVWPTSRDVRLGRRISTKKACADHGFARDPASAEGTGQ